MKNKRISIAFRIASVWCTLFVIYRHSLNFAAFYPDCVSNFPDNYNTQIQNYIMYQTRLAVPFFFIMSGFFFFKNESLSIYGYRQKMKSRIKTLFVPYLFWMLIGLAILIVSKQISIENFNWFELLSGKYSFHLWYVASLMVLVVCSLVMECMRRVKVLSFMVLLFLAWCWIPVDCNILSTEGVLFFFIGSLCSDNTLERLILPLKWIIPAAVLWFFIPFISIEGWNLLFSKMSIIIGVLLFWNICYHYSYKYNEYWTLLASCSFFVFCAHFFSIKIMKVSIAQVFSYNDLVSLLCFLILPIVTFVLLYAIALFLRKYTSKLYNVISGGR